MALFTIALLATIGVSLTIQAWLVLWFTQVLKRRREPLLDDMQCPEAAVILCLRGGDPFLHRCVEALLRQDYPRYRIVVVVDHEQDPALPILRQALSSSNDIPCEIQFLAHPPGTCSLKCASLLQAYRSLPESVSTLAQLDADTIPHPSWLRELATGLSDDSVGAVTGNRWYAPEHPSRGAMVRHVWNAAAIVQMSCYRIAWGGTLAIRMSAIRDAQLDKRWGEALCEDTMLTSQLSRIGKRVAFQPHLIMVNREDCSLSSFIPWVSRQLLTARLYHRAWPLVVIHGITSAAILIIGWGSVLVLACTQQYQPIGIIAGAMAFFQLAMVFLVLWIGQAVESSLARNGRITHWTEPSFMRWLWIVSITQGAYSWALLRCLASSSTEWRGIRYRIAGPWKITMERYQPYSDSPQSLQAGTKASL